MELTARDILLGAALFLAFPAAINLTHLASSEPGSPGDPIREPASLTAPAHP